MKKDFFVARIKRWDMTQFQVIANKLSHDDAVSMVRLIQESVALEVGGYDKSQYCYSFGIIPKDATI